MKAYSAESIRNVCFLAHVGVGKTTLAEAACYTAKTTNKMGSVDNGTSVFDARSDEKDRKMTISMTTGYCEWQDTKINILDAPGFLDFVGDTVAALRAVETAVILLDATSGIEVGTEIAYRHVKERESARLFFVNCMDKENADFNQTLESAKAAFGTSVAPLVIPIGSAGDFKGVIDLVSKQAYQYERGGKGIGKKVDIPADMADAVESARAGLMEAVAESDEELMNAFFEAGELTDDQLRQGLSKGVAQGLVYP
ncbi:MAG: GTP-binding protein, partial [Chitinivibrionales bacterium]|nr:GTP-binding protein [Chitinivibrionales bacterium]